MKPSRLLCTWTSPGKNTGMGSQSLLWGTFLTQGSNLALPHCRRILYHLTTGEALPPLSSVQFSSVAQLCPTLCDPMNRSTPGLPVHHQLPDSTQTHVTLGKFLHSLSPYCIYKEGVIIIACSHPVIRLQPLAPDEIMSAEALKENTKRQICGVITVILYGLGWKGR